VAGEFAINSSGLNEYGLVPFFLDPYKSYEGPLTRGYDTLRSQLDVAHQQGPIRVGEDIPVDTVAAVAETLGGVLFTVCRDFAEHAAPTSLTKQSLMSRMFAGKPRRPVGWVDIVWWAAYADGGGRLPPYSIEHDGQVTGIGNPRTYIPFESVFPPVTAIEAGIAMMHERPSADLVHWWRGGDSVQVLGDLRYSGMYDNGDQIARGGRAARFVLDRLTDALTSR
jgi:hypothetical protein